MKKWYERFGDAAFATYFESGEAWAVHIVRDEAIEVDNTGKWIDVLDIGEFQGEKGQFRWIAAELLPRITKPAYTSDTELNRYLCWAAAHNDIAAHREKGAHGPKYLVLLRWLPGKNKKEGMDWQVIADRHVQQKHLAHPEQCAKHMLNGSVN